MKKQKLTLNLNKRKISAIGAAQLIGGGFTATCTFTITIGGQAGCGNGSGECPSGEIYCGPSVKKCNPGPSDAPRCTLESIDLSFCGSGTVPPTCQSNQVCA
ncbi:MAG: hypothetical protein AAF611_14320 [Bacteroidota bacterium]